MEKHIFASVVVAYERRCQDIFPVVASVRLSSQVIRHSILTYFDRLLL